MKGRHSTDYEIEFIKKIGETHIDTRNIHKKVMLKRYIQACELRSNWDGLDKDKILAAANMELYASI